MLYNYILMKINPNGCWHIFLEYGWPLQLVFAIFTDLIPPGHVMALYIPLHVQMLASRNYFEHVILFFFPANMTIFCLNDEEFQ